MYQLIIDNRDGERYVIHDSRSNRIRVTEAKCDMELNRTGTLSFKINPTHPNFDKIFKHKSEIYLFQDNECIFCGRVLNDEVDIYNFKTIVCEGMLGYLLDSVQKAKIHPLTGATKLNDYLTEILNIHNSQVDDYKRFSVGVISEVDTSDTPVYKVSSYEDTLTTLNKCLVDSYNHTYLSAGFINGEKVINFVNSKELPPNNQIIRSGKNLIKLTRTIKGEDIATAIIPLGAKTNTEEIEDATVDYKLDISDVADFTEGTIKHTKGTDYIYDEDAVNKYGYIFKAIEFSDEEDTQVLVDKAIEQLNYYNKLASKLELNAFDLHLLDVNIDSFRVGQKVRVYSPNHDLKDLDTYLIVQKMSIDLDSPDKTMIVLGNEERILIDITSSISKKSNQNDNNIITLEKELNDKKWNYLDKDYFDTIDYKNKFKDTFNDFSTGDDYKNNFKDTFTDYSKTTPFDNNMKDYFNSQNGTGSITDLSKYALKSDVQESFDTLSNLLKGV